MATLNKKRTTAFRILVWENVIRRTTVELTGPRAFFFLYLFFCLRLALPRLASKDLLCKTAAPSRQQMSGASVVLPHRHQVEHRAFRILEAQIWTETLQRNPGCAKRRFGSGGIGNPQGHVVRIAKRLVVLRLKQRQL